MTELEILAQLKHAYLSLEDIVENADRVQIEDKSYIKISMELISKEYSQMYRKIQEENEESLFYAEDIMVAQEIYFDYTTRSDDYDDQFLHHSDYDEKKWWEDYEFLTR